jgi:hypothetical protein
VTVTRCPDSVAESTGSVTLAIVRLSPVLSGAATGLLAGRTCTRTGPMPVEMVLSTVCTSGPRGLSAKSSPVPARLSTTTAFVADVGTMRAFVPPARLTDVRSTAVPEAGLQAI